MEECYLNLCVFLSVANNFHVYNNTNVLSRYPKILLVNSNAFSKLISNKTLV